MDEDDACAQIVALMVATTRSRADKGMEALDRDGAFRLLGVDRERFIELVNLFANGLAPRLAETSWLRESDQLAVDALLDRVTDIERRLEVCRLAWMALEADGDVAHAERTLYSRMLATWHLDAKPPMTAPAT